LDWTVILHVVDLDTCLFFHDKFVCRYALKTPWYAIASSGTNEFDALIRYQAAFQNASVASMYCSTALPLFVDCKYHVGPACGLARGWTPELTEVRPVGSGP